MIKSFTPAASLVSHRPPVLQSMRSDVLFVTSTLGTPWETYSQALIRRGFPNCRRVLIDGRDRWHPLNFVDICFTAEERYIVHIDEDCFLLDPSQLDDLLMFMDQNQRFIMAGTPDGGTFHRDHNPCACNLFFLVIQREELARVLARNAKWRESRWDESYRALCGSPVNALDESRIQYDGYEDYYSLFWAVLASGGRVHYMLPRIDEGTYGAILVQGSGKMVPMLLHMWWLRKWKDKAVEPYLGVSHWSRYQQIKAHLDSRIRKTFAEKLCFIALELPRIWRQLCRWYNVWRQRISNRFSRRTK